MGLVMIRFAIVGAVALFVPLAAWASDPSTVNTKTIDMEKKEGVVGNQAYSDWMFSRRKSDPLSVGNGVKMYFREKRMATEVDVKPDQVRGLDGSTNSLVGEENRAKIRAVTRFREVPMEQLPQSIVDLTNEHKELNPVNSRTKKFYFVPADRSTAHKMDGNGVLQDTGAQPTESDFVVRYNRDLPWTDREGTILYWAKRNNSGAQNCVVFINGSSVRGGPGAGITQAPGGMVVDMLAMGPWHASSGKKGMIIAYDHNGTGKKLIVKNAFALAGPVQLVSNIRTIVVGGIGTDPDLGNVVQEALPWAKKPEDAPWILMAPDVVIGSPYSLQMIESGQIN